MRYVRTTLNDLAKRTIDIGYVGERNHTRIVFFCHSLFDENPDAVASLDIKPPSGAIYQGNVVREDDAVVWYVSSDDVSVAGSGLYQLTFTDGEEVIKQAIGSFSVKPSLV